MSSSRIAAIGVSAVLVSGLLAAATSTGGAPVGQSAPGVVNPAHFNNPKPNPYFPLKPGTVSRFRGSDEGKRLHERVTVTSQRRTIQGVRANVLLDVLRRADGSLAEKTHDWYAADNHGNVWYFGEATATYDARGHVASREGSWKAGAHGAVAGLIMPRHPQPTDAYRQEFYSGHAEDQAWIVQRDGTVAVPYGKLHHVVRSYEWSRLEPGVLSVKFYGRGLGIVREKDVAGGTEVFELVAVSHS
jgi:hypothetical protein